MILEAAQQVRDGLAELIRLVNCGGASTMDARQVLSESKAFAAPVAVLQASRCKEAGSDSASFATYPLFAVV